MALQAWVGRSAAQLDADSPLDITLHNSYDDDLIHLRQVLYGDGAGTFLTPIDGHRHNGSDSQLVTSVADGAVSTTAKLANAIVTQAKLKTTLSAVSQSSIAITNYIFTGGSYCMYPQIYHSTGACLQNVHIATNIYRASYTTNISIENVTGAGCATPSYAQTRYITSSGKEHWVFLLFDLFNNRIAAGSSAPDHPSFGNGSDENVIPHPFADYFDKDPLDDNYEIICVDIGDVNSIKKRDLAELDSSEILRIINEGYLPDMSKTVNFKPRDMDGQKILQQPHTSYTVRGLKKK